MKNERKRGGEVGLGRLRGDTKTPRVDPGGRDPRCGGVVPSEGDGTGCV